MPLGAAFLTYEAVLFAATWILPSGPGAFAPAVLARVLAINVGTYAALLALPRIAAAVRLSAVPRPSRQPI